MKSSKLFWKWICSNRVLVLYNTIIVCVICLVYGLYGYPFRVVGYTLVLSAAIGIVFVGIQYGKYKEVYKDLNHLKGEIPLEGLPVMLDPIGREYNRIILDLEKEIIRLSGAEERYKNDADQYYTLWVHQIKTPIAAMRLLLQQDTSEESLTTLKTQMEKELFRTEQYVGMVLQYQRLASLQSDLVLEKYSVEGLVRNAVKNLAPLFIYQNLPIAIEPIDFEIVTDSKWFVFVIEQILSNSLKYTKKGRIRVYGEGDRQLVIEDTGIGILLQDLPRVFERGFTGVIGREERRSTGVGLYLSKEILTRLGFTIHLTSENGIGTKVFLGLTQSVIEEE